MELIDAELVSSLAARIEGLAATSSGTRVLIGIAGAHGAGKTTLAEALVRRLAGRDDWRGSHAAHVPMDGFHLADTELDRLGLRDRKGTPETFDAGGYAAVLARIGAGDDVYAPSFERTLEQPIAGALPVVAATRFVISEGNYLLLTDDPWTAVHDAFDEVWFCCVDEAERQRRSLDRHVRFGKTPEAAAAWIAAVDDPNAALVEASAGRADLVLDLG